MIGGRASRVLALELRVSRSAISLAFRNSTAMNSSRAVQEQVDRWVAATRCQDVLRVLAALRELEEAKKLLVINGTAGSTRKSVEAS